MAEKKTIELDVQSNLGSLRSQLRQAQAEVAAMADKFGETSEQARQAAKRAAELKDRIGDAKALTDAFNPEAKFNALGQSINSVSGAFTVMEGVMGLVGVESENLQKQLLKVQSAMAITQGLEALGGLPDSFRKIKAVVIDSYNAVSKWFTGLSTASKAFAITGIGLLITAVELLIENWDEWFGTSKKVEEQQKRIAEQAKEQRESIAKESGAFATLISRLKNTNEGSKERDKLIRQINSQYGTTLKNIKDETKFQEQLNKELASYLQYQKAKYILQKNEDAIVRNLEAQSKLKGDIKKSQAEEIRLAIELQKVKSGNLIGGAKSFTSDASQSVGSLIEKLNDAKNKTNNLKYELKKAEDRFQSYGKSANYAASQMDALTNSGTKYVEQNNNVVSSNEQVVESVEEWQLTEQEFYDKINALKKENYLNTLSEQEKEIELVNDKYTELEFQAQNNADALAEIELAKLNEINDINLKYQDLAYKADKEAKDKKALADKEAADKEIADAKAVAEQKAAIQQQGLDTALQGVQLIKELFENSKGVQKASVIAESAIGIAKMVIANKLANTAALATPQAIATSGAAAAPVIAMNNISTGIGIAANIAATAKALKTLGGGSAPSGGNLGGVSGSGSGVMSANFNVVGNSGFNQLAQLQQQPMKAYVVSGDVTTAQALDRNRIENATLVQ